MRLGRSVFLDIPAGAADLIVRSSTPRLQDKPAGGADVPTAARGASLRNSAPADRDTPFRTGRSPPRYLIVHVENHLRCSVVPTLGFNDCLQSQPPRNCRIDRERTNLPSPTCSHGRQGTKSSPTPAHAACRNRLRVRRAGSKPGRFTVPAARAAAFHLSSIRRT